MNQMLPSHTFMQTQLQFTETPLHFNQYSEPSSLSLQCFKQQQEIMALRSEVSAQRLTIQSQAARCIELESAIFKVQADFSLAMSENSRLSANLAALLAHDSKLNHLIHTQHGAVAAIRHDQQALSGELLARTMEREALDAMVHRQRAALQLERADADRAAALLGSHQALMLRGELHNGGVWVARRGALPPVTATVSAVAPTVEVGPPELALGFGAVPPQPRVVSVADFAAGRTLEIAPAAPPAEQRRFAPRVQ